MPHYKVQYRPYYTARQTIRTFEAASAEAARDSIESEGGVVYGVYERKMHREAGGYGPLVED